MLNIEILDGGSVVTRLSWRIKVNKGSSLHRSWMNVNDPSCPMQLSDSGIESTFRDEAYHFSPVGSVRSSKAVQAFDIRYVLYDVFGEHLDTLCWRRVVDLDPKESFSLDDAASWYAHESTVSELLTVVAFIALVRENDGAIWRFNQQAIEEELTRIQLTVAGVFEPSGVAEGEDDE